MEEIKRSTQDTNPDMKVETYSEDAGVIHEDNVHEDVMHKDNVHEDDVHEDNVHKDNEVNDTKINNTDAKYLKENDMEKAVEKTVERTSKRDFSAFWRFVSMVFFIISVISIGYIVILKQQSIPVNVSPTSTITLTPTGTAAPTEAVKETRFDIVDLASYVKQLNSAVLGQFTASVEKLYGYEYLCLTYQNIKIYYRNEFDVEGTDGYGWILLDNGDKKSEFYWDYNISNGIDKLVPQYGSFSGDKKSELLFIVYQDYSTIPERIRLIDADNLWDYGTIYLKDEIRSKFSVLYQEVPSTEQVADAQSQMTVGFGGIGYTYLIDGDDYIDAVYYGAEKFYFDDNFTFNITEDLLSFTTVAYIREGMYLGEITGTLIKKDYSLQLSNIKYGAYVDYTQEDSDSDGLIIPRKYIMGDRLIMSGKNGERYLIAVNDAIQPNSINWNNWVAEDGEYKYYVNDEAVSIKGIDVSKYQGEIDWNLVKEAGVEFAIIRLGFRGYGEGTLEIDPYFTKNIMGANQAGIKVGVYFFSQAVTDAEAEEEANFVLSKLEGYNVSYPVVYDTEDMPTVDARANGISIKQRTSNCITFCEKIKSAGYTPMIYANTRYMIMGLDLSQLNAYDKWFAYYGTDYTFPYSFSMFQYTDSGSVAGINGAVDLNVSFIDFSIQ